MGACNMIPREKFVVGDTVRPSAAYLGQCVSAPPRYSYDAYGIVVAVRPTPLFDSLTVQWDDEAKLVSMIDHYVTKRSMF